MKKLNNKGWSLNTMLVLIAVLTLIIIAVSILVYNYGIEKDSPNPLFNINTEKVDE